MAIKNDNGITILEKTNLHRKTKHLSNRLNIPLPDDIRRELEREAMRDNISLAELGRRVIEKYLVDQRRQQRLSQLRNTVQDNAELLKEVSREWEHIETENWLGSAD